MRCKHLAAILLNNYLKTNEERLLNGPSKRAVGVRKTTSKRGLESDVGLPRRARRNHRPDSLHLRTGDPESRRRGQAHPCFPIVESGPAAPSASTPSACGFAC